LKKQNPKSYFKLHQLEVFFPNKRCQLLIKKIVEMKQRSIVKMRILLFGTLNPQFKPKMKHSEMELAKLGKSKKKENLQILSSKSQTFSTFLIRLERHSESNTLMTTKIFCSIRLKKKRLQWKEINWLNT
jgi:hypothetical protein